MKRARARIKALTSRNRAHQDIREVIAMINPSLAGVAVLIVAAAALHLLLKAGERRLARWRPRVVT